MYREIYDSYFNSNNFPAIKSIPVGDLLKKIAETNETQLELMKQEINNSKIEVEQAKKQATISNIIALFSLIVAIVSFFI